MVGVSFPKTSSSLQWNGLLSMRHHRLITQREMLMLNEQLVYTKCKDDFLLGLLVHSTTPLLYMRSKLSLAELLFGHRLASNLPIIHFSKSELVAE